MGVIKDFIRHHFRHFNAAALLDGAEGWQQHISKGGHMLLTLGGAMSTAEMGLSIAELIRNDRIHALCMTGANLEEDLFNLVAHDHYKRIPCYRSLTAQQELALHQQGMNRVTDTCIPEEEAIRHIADEMLKLWQQAEARGTRHAPHAFFYELIQSRKLESAYHIDPKDSWLVAAAQKNLPLWTPGWEDSTLGNIFVASVIQKKLQTFQVVKNGLEQMQTLVDWYIATSQHASLGFFQIGGGIAGDFPICVVPLIRQDLAQACPVWQYFCQISDSTTSYGSYSGATPQEKISWGKLGVETPQFIIESDASIVFPLMAQYVLES